MIEKIALKIRGLLSFNPRLAYYRDHLRPKILNAPIVENTSDASAELHVLTSSKDWLNLVWSLKSFYEFVDTKYALVIHGDTSLRDEHIDCLQTHFPEARIITQTEAKDNVLETLSAFPNCRRLREENTLSIKVFDFLHYLNADRMILFDSDLLFFARPTAFLAALEQTERRQNAFNRDVATAYAIASAEIEAAGFEVHPEVNSGFGIVYRDSMPLEWLEEFLSIPGLIDGHFWRIEQTLYALCASRYGVKLLPEDYRVFLDGAVGERPFRHYVGAIRNQMYVEGMRKLSDTLIR